MPTNYNIGFNMASSVAVLATRVNNRVPTLSLEKIQDFSRTFKDPREKFSRTFSEPMNA